MKSVLDHFTPVKAVFRPRVGGELFALRLAQKLDDAHAIAHYVSLSHSHTESQLLCAYRRTLRRAHNGARGRVFLKELERTRNASDENGDGTLIAIRVERRAVAAAIFYGDHLEYSDSRQLSSSPEKARSSAVGFILWMLNRFPVESAALEAVSEGNDFQRRALHDDISKALRNSQLPIWEIPRTVLLESYGHPPLKSRNELREISTSIWPILEGPRAKVFVQDAAILGLHVQTERLFIIN